jgi:hypothetical protein
MGGKVFVSCGQRGPERDIALSVSNLLHSEFGLRPYLAFRIQSLNDIMTITRELRDSDYYLFIDFLRRRKKAEDLTCSLFTHQELALAHHLGFEDMIALQQNGCGQEGFLKYVLGNPEFFSDQSDLLEKLRKLVKERKWSKEYSRNLVVGAIRVQGPLSYGDHTGQSLMRVREADIENHRPDMAAVNTVCILDTFNDGSGPKHSIDRSYLKWSGQQGYEQTILPKDFGRVALLSTHHDRPGVFLISTRDVCPREPIVVDNGDYTFAFKAFSTGFPVLEFCVKVRLNWQPIRELSWSDRSTAELLTIASQSPLPEL